LKLEVAPSDRAQKQEILAKWQKLKTTAKSSTDIESWLREWHSTYDEGVILKIPDIIDDSRPHYNFLQAVFPIAPTFADMMEKELLLDAIP